MTTTVWILVLHAILAGNQVNVFIGAFDTQAHCLRFIGQEAEIGMKVDGLVCERNEVKTYR